MDEKYAMQPATKGDVEQVVNKVVDHAVEKLAVMIGNGFAETDKRFAAIETRLGKIENILLEEQRRKIADLENRVKQLEDVIAV